MEELHPHSLVLSPKQLEGIFKIFPDRPPAGLQSFLTSADWCDPSLAARVRGIWRVASIDHYGITESCFGFALECNCHDGYHIRHLDVFCEIVDPLTGRVLDIDPETGRTAVGELVSLSCLLCATVLATRRILSPGPAPAEVRIPVWVL